jgi:radical SAM protein with 4Fe4S-binding SPASM domain
MESVSSSQDYDTCFGLPFFAIINEKGNVEPCHMYYDSPDFAYGNIYENSFKDIWTSKKRKLAIIKIKEKGIHECKKGCRLDLINKYLKRIKNPDAHENFI